VLVCLLGLWVVQGVGGRPLSTSECPRLESAQARRIVEVVIQTMAEDLGRELLPSCPMHPSKDVYSRQNRHKEVGTNTLWRCGFCNKQFRSEAYLDRHMDWKHATEVDSNTTTCMADFCDVLGCPAHHHHHPDGHEHAQAHHGEDSEHAIDRCMHLIQSCIDVDWTSARGHEVLESSVRNFCEKDPCEHGRTAGLTDPASARPTTGPWLFLGVLPLWALVMVAIFSLVAIVALCMVFVEDWDELPAHDLPRSAHIDRAEVYRHEQVAPVRRRKQQQPSDVAIAVG
jgi:hypothetical protein